MNPLFAQGAFIGVATFAAIILAAALFGPTIGQSGLRGAIGLLSLVILAAIVGGAVAMVSAP